VFVGTDISEMPATSIFCAEGGGIMFIYILVHI
jgi:hypothetical protein